MPPPKCIIVRIKSNNLQPRNARKKRKEGLLVTPLRFFGWLLVLFFASTLTLVNVSFRPEKAELLPGEGLMTTAQNLASSTENMTAEHDIEYLITLSKDGNHDKDEILLLLRNNAGLSTLTQEKYQQLPTWSDITSLYGSEPKVVGLDQCPTFQEHLNKVEGDHKGLAVAGMFNSGTNLLNLLLSFNCNIQFTQINGQKRYLGIYAKPPWGKHNPPNITVMDDPRQLMPVVTIRDPFRWMQSMCKASYAADWALNRYTGKDPKDKHCPPLIPTERDKELLQWLRKEPLVSNGTQHHFAVNVQYSKQHVTTHYSLAHLWNDWYQEYLDLFREQAYPGIMLRMEDLVFFPNQVIPKLCECAGGRMIAHNKEGNVKIPANSAKNGMDSNKQTSYVDAIIQYGSERNRYAGMTRQDLQYAQEHLDGEKMDIFRYLLPKALVPK